MPDLTEGRRAGSLPEIPADPAPAIRRHAFAYREYRLFWVARLCSTLAQNCLVIIIGWQVYDLARHTMSTREASLQLGLVGLVQFLPLFSLVLVTGWVADRIDRRFIVRSTTALQLLCAIVLAWVSGFARVPIAAIFAVAAALGVARAFSMPALGALAPNLVPPALLPSAIAANSIASRAGAIVGPAIAGYLYAWRAPAPYVFGAVLFGVSLACMAAIRSKVGVSHDPTRRPWQQMIDGLVFVRRNGIVLGAISLDLFAVLLGGATAMLPVYARDILQVGPAGLGHLRAAPAVGALAIAIWFTYRPLERRVGMKMLAAVAVFGAATVGFGLSRSMGLSLACLAILGAADLLSVFVRQSLIQISTPDAMRGRVGAVSSLFISASNELGEVESGFLAALIGPVAAVVAGGAGAILVACLWAKVFPALRTANKFE